MGRIVILVEPTCLLEPVIERSTRYRRQHAHTRSRDARLTQETFLGRKYHLVVIVETQDHAGPDLHAAVLDPPHLLRKAAAPTQILQLLGLLQRLLVRRLDADEDGGDISSDHELHKLLVIGEIDRGFRNEHQRIAIALLPTDHVLQNLLDGLFVADEVVVDDEDDRQFLSAQGVEFSEDLRRSLETRPPAEDDDDVAELAGKRAAARELHRAKGVAVHLQEIEPRHGYPAEIRLLFLLITLVN